MTTSAESLVGAAGPATVRGGIRRAELTGLAVSALQLGILVLLIRQFEIESPTFQRLAQLTFAGFIIHGLLPLRYRLSFFVLLSLAGIGLVFGVGGGAWLVGIGIGLIAIAHLPIRFGLRVGALLAATIPLALLRIDLVPAPIPLAVWPILTSMFMFRLVIYMYDLGHAPPPFSLPRTLAYFFMLPNLTFPLFPPVDYKTFARVYYEVDAFRTCQRGLHWIFRGIVHLILYRLVYHYMALDPADVTNGPQLVMYIVSGFLLYLRVSGIFHIAIGILHLFGFYLPETNSLYLLASSFTDLWRRNSIYWKDAMMKLVYYPSFFRLRRKGNLRAITLSMIAVFVVTWAGHSIQWFWLRGEPLLTLQDVSFYLILGTLVVVTAVREARQGSARLANAASRTGWSFQRAWGTLTTMGILMLLWSYWTADSLPQWFRLWEVAGRWTWTGALLVVGIGAAWFLIAGWPWKPLDVGELLKHRPAYTAALPISALAGGLFLVGEPAVQQRLDGPLQGAVQLVTQHRLNRKDEAALLRGYYEKVDSRTRMGGELAEMYNLRERNTWQDMFESAAWRWTNDYRLGELAPSVTMDYHGLPFSTNRWGMRDSETTLEKPAGVYRIAIMGASDLMGLGVADDENYASVLERMLNDRNPGTAYHRYEVLNFGVFKHSIWQHAALLDTKILQFQPDLVLLSYHPSQDPRVASDRLAQVATSGYEMPYPELAAIIRESGLVATEDTVGAMRIMKPFGPRILAWSLRHIADVCRQNGMPPVLLHLRLPGAPAGINEGLDIAADAGYLILTVDDYGGRDEATLRVASWDRHPNAEGHRLVAEQLFQALTQHQDSLRLGLGPARPAPPHLEEQ